MDETTDGPPRPVDDAVGTIPADPDPLRPYRSWARALFAILLLMAVVVSALVLSAVPSVSPVVLASAMASALAGIAVLTAVVVGLGRAEPWAIHAIGPLCVVLIVFGVGRSLLALTASEISIPLEAIGGAFVLSRDHRATLLPPLDARGRRTRSVAVLVFITIQLLSVASPYVATAPPLATTSDDLALGLELDCPPAPSCS